MNKFERQGAILRLVGERELSTQSDVVDALRDEGLDAVQATVSRDIAQLGLVKVRGESGRLVYAHPGAADLDRLGELTTALRRWVVSLEPAAGVVVLRTPPACANAVAIAFDEARSRRSQAASPATTRSSLRPGRARPPRSSASSFATTWTGTPRCRSRPRSRSTSGGARSPASATGQRPSSRPFSISPTS